MRYRPIPTPNPSAPDYERSAAPHTPVTPGVGYLITSGRNSRGANQTCSVVVFSAPSTAIA